MSEELKYKLFTPTDCIPEQTMFDYIDNKLSPKEQHAVEKHMLDCELCSDALEGLRMVKERSRIGIINEKIAKRMAAPADKKILRFNSRVFTSIAAGFVLLIGSVFFFKFFISNNMKDAAVAELKETSQNETEQTDNDSNNANAPVVPGDANPSPPPLTTKSSSADEIDALEKSGKATEALTQELEIQDGEKKPNVPEEPSAGRAVNSAITAGNTTTVTPDAAREEDYSNDKSLTDVSKANQSNTITLEKAEDQQQVIVNPAPEKDRKRAMSKNDEKEYERRVLKEQSETKNTNKGVVLKTEGKKKEAEKYNRQDDRESTVTGAGDVVYIPVETKANDNRVGMIADSISLAGIKANGELFSYEFTTSADEQPKYPGGDTAMLKFIARNFQYSGASYKADGLPATKIITEFTVDKTGAIKNAKIKKGINPTLDKEALRVINSMPEWIPAVKNGKAVDAVFTLPIQLDFK